MTKAFFFIFLSSIGAVTSNVLLRKTLGGRSLASGGLSELFWNFLGLFREPLIWMASVAFGFAFVFWILALSSMKISIAYPVQTALVFVFTGIASYIVFQEPLSLKMMIGYLLIIGGITLVSV